MIACYKGRPPVIRGGGVGGAGGGGGACEGRGGRGGAPTPRALTSLVNTRSGTAHGAALVAEMAASPTATAATAPTPAGAWRSCGGERAGPMLGGHSWGRSVADCPVACRSRLDGSLLGAIHYTMDASAHSVRMASTRLLDDATVRDGKLALALSTSQAPWFATGVVPSAPSLHGVCAQPPCGAATQWRGVPPATL